MVVAGRVVVRAYQLVRAEEREIAADLVALLLRRRR